MEITNLSKIGLTQGEIKVYLAAVKYGAQTKSTLAKNAEVSSSKVYEIAEKLIKKGLAGSFIKNNVLYYTASDPTFLREYVHNKEKELQEEKKIVDSLIPQLKNMKTNSEEDISFELYEGFKGLQNACFDALSKMNKEDTMYGIAMPREITEFSNKFNRERVKKKIKSKVLFSKNPSEELDMKDAECRFIEGLSEIGMGIFKNRILFASTGKKPISLMIKHPKIVETFLNIYKVLWKNSKSQPNSHY